MSSIAVDMSPIIYGSRAIKRCTECMVKELIRHEKNDFHLYYIDYKCQKKKYLRPLYSDVKETVIPIPYRLLLPLWKKFSWPTLDSFIQSCDIVYVNDFYFPPAPKAIVLATVHGLAYRIIPEKLPNRIVQLLEKGISYALKHSDYLIAVSETTKKELVNSVGVNPDRIYVITHGVDKRFRQRKNKQNLRYRLKANFRLDTPYILYVGAIAFHKNVMGILSAFALTSQETTHNLVLAGPTDSAWDRANRFVVDSNLSERVHFLGHIYDTEKLVDLYNGADLFVFTSFYEGWTSPPLEAMACGTPVIASNCSSLPETLGDAAIYIDPYNSDELASEMLVALSNKSLRRKMISKGLNHVASQSWEEAAAKLMNTFADIQEKGRWRGME